MKLSKIIVASALLAATGVAQAELSANIAASSNYIWRGVSQSDDAAAVSGGIDYNHESGFYLGTWLSTIDFASAGSPKADAELDLYAGFGGEAGSIGYDLGVIAYLYPGAGGDDQGGELDFTEIYAGLSFGPVSGSIAYNVDAEAPGPGAFQDGDIYLNASADLPVDFEGFGASVFVGTYIFEDDGDSAVGDLDYTHWGISVSKDAADFGSFSFNYEQTNENDTASPDDNPNFWVGWSKDF